MTRQYPTTKVSKTGTISSTAKSLLDMGFTQDEIDEADVALISIFDDNVRWRKDGTDPTAALGHYLPKDATPLSIGGNADLQRLKLIRITTNAGYLVELES